MMNFFMDLQYLGPSSIPFICLPCVHALSAQSYVDIHNTDGDGDVDVEVDVDVDDYMDDDQLYGIYTDMMGEEEKEQRVDNIGSGSGSDTDSWKLEQCGGC